MDKPHTFGKPNLTVALCHERFQAEAGITDQQKATEQTLYDALVKKYEAAAFRDFRNKWVFHVDLEQNLTPPVRSGNTHEITSLLLDWYSHVGNVVMGGEPKFVTVGGRLSGKAIAKQFVQMMAATLRDYRQRQRDRASGVP